MPLATLSPHCLLGGSILLVLVQLLEENVGERKLKRGREIAPLYPVPRLNAKMASPSNITTFSAVTLKCCTEKVLLGASRLDHL